MAEALSVKANDVSVRECLAGDVEQLGGLLCRADLDDIREVHGDRSPASVVQEWAEASRVKWTVATDGQVLAMLGAARLPGCGDNGVPWVFFAAAAKRHWRSIALLTPAYIARMLFEFPQLVNGISVNNRQGIQWLRQQGFTVLPPQPGPKGLRLHPYFRKAETCAPLQ